MPHMCTREESQHLVSADALGNVNRFSHRQIRTAQGNGYCNAKP